MTRLSRRQCCARLATLRCGFAAARCATVSPQEERQIGRKEAEELERTVGLARERRIVEYVEAIGARLARAAGRLDIAWQWSVADEPDANAFASRRLRLRRVVDINALSALAPLPRAPVPRPSRPQPHTPPPAGAAGTAQLMRRAFDTDVRVCPACGGRLRLLATILDPGTIRVILVSLGLATELADRAPPEDPAPATADLVAGARRPISSRPSPPVIGRGLSSLADSVPLLALISTVEVGASVKIPA